MKPIYLEFCGINSFSERAEINFTQLLEFGIFGIFGDTGSGKSTILDCIGFALYGSVSRSRTGSIADIIHYKKNEAYVNFEFEIVSEGVRKIYRVERTLKRKNAAQTVIVYEKAEETLTVVSSGYRESNAYLERLIGLEQKDFEKCIALPQGEFAQFVKAQRGERLKLISRLFDLEQYGERLVKRVNAKFAESHSAVLVCEAKLEPFQEVTKERILELKNEIEAYRLCEHEVASNLLVAREQEKKIVALLQRKQEAERAEYNFKCLLEKKDEIDALGKELSRLERAMFVLASKTEGVALRERCVRAEENERASEVLLQQARKNCADAESWDEAQTDAEIERLSALRVRAEEAEAYRRKKKRAEERIALLIKEEQKEEQSFTAFEYEKTKHYLETQLDGLGTGDFFAFAEMHGKAALLRDEYQTFADEIDELTLKYPEISEDSRVLSERYRTLATGDKIDYGELRRAYESRESKRKKIQFDLLHLEQEKGKFDLHLQRMARVREELLRLREESADCDVHLDSVRESLSDVEKSLEDRKREKREKSALRAKAQEQLISMQGNHITAREQLSSAKLALEEGKVRFRETLKTGGFQNIAEAEALVGKYGKADDAKTRYEKFRSDFAAAQALYEKTRLSDADDVSEDQAEQIRADLAKLEAEAAENAKKITLFENDCARTEQLLEKKTQLEKEYKEAQSDCNRFERLKKLLGDNKFMEFVAEEYLQTIASNASGRLLSLTDGRYFLRYEKGFFVGDNFNGGQLRGVYTLSGGETFLVSLSLALALGAEICARSLRPIEFFFLDEGFGTLDEKLIDTVMDSLEKLRSEHFSIGIISHVEELKHRIDRKLSVIKATEKHGSQIHVE